MVRLDWLCFLDRFICLEKKPVSLFPLLIKPSSPQPILTYIPWTVNTPTQPYLPTTPKTTTPSFNPCTYLPFFFLSIRIFAFLIYRRRDPFYSIRFKHKRITQTHIPNPILKSRGGSEFVRTISSSQFSSFSNLTERTKPTNTLVVSHQTYETEICGIKDSTNHPLSRYLAPPFNRVECDKHLTF